ncbi:MAG: EamA family transporter, partial [Anaerolineae bacterium]
MERLNRSIDPVQRGVLLIMTAASLWGTAGPATQALYGVASTTPFSISALRLTIAAPLMLLLCWRLLGRRMFAVARRDLLVMMLMGVLLGLSQASYFAAISNAGVAIATLTTVCSTPIIVTIVSTLVTRERPGKWIIAALLCALVGTTLLVNVQPNPELADTTLAGMGFSLLASAIYAGFILSGRLIVGHYHPLQTSAIGLLTGSILMCTIATGAGFALSYPAQGWLLLLYLGAVPTALAYGLFFSGTRTTPATVVSILTLMEPLMATALAWLLFGE